MAGVAGIVLAAGAGSRMGRPKALMHSADGRGWLTSAVQALDDGGCSPVVVVLGAGAVEARELLGGVDVRVVQAQDWASGMGAALRAGLAALADEQAAMIHLVDLPDVGAAVVARVLEHAAPDALARADYGRGPAHPVLLGREHWPGVLASAQGDRGARDYLRCREVLRVDCSDLATGLDLDEPGDLEAPTVPQTRGEPGRPPGR